MRCCCLSPLVLGLAVVLVAALVALDTQKEQFYIFDQEVLREISLKAIASSNDTSAVFQSVADQLAARYPGHVETDQECSCQPLFFMPPRY